LRVIAATFYKEDVMRSRFVVLVAVALSACGVDKTTSPPQVTHPGKVSVETQEQIARALAVSMQDETIRHRVRDDMRASPWTSHKLDLWSYVTNEGGPAIQQAVATKLGTSVDRMAANYSTLQPYDFSVRNNEDRMAWHGDLNYIVAVAPEREGDVAIAYTPNGEREVIRTPADIGSGIVFVLQPAEPKHIRLNPQPYRPNATTIQDPDDGTFSGSVTLVSSTPSGADSVTIDYSDRQAVQRQQVCPEPELCPGGGGGGGSGGGGTEGSTYVEDVFTNNICDTSPICTDNEFEFTGQWVLGSVIVTGTARVENVGSTELTGRYGVHALMVPRQPNSYIPVKIIAVKETDLVNSDIFCPTGNTLYDNSANSLWWNYNEAPGCDIQTPPTLFVRFSWTNY
jgi:hypothetical protein